MKKLVFLGLFISLYCNANENYVINCETITLKPLKIVLKSNDNNEFMGFVANGLEMNSDPEISKNLDENMNQIIEYTASVTPAKTSEYTDSIILDYNTVTHEFDGTFFHNLQFNRVTSSTTPLYFDCKKK